MARRVNTRFLGILAAGAVGVVGVVFIAQKTLVHASPDQFRQLAQDAEKNHQYADEVTDWAKAVSAAPQDPALWTSYGRALHALGETDPELAAKHKDLDAWQHALELKPNYAAGVPQQYLPAISDLVDYWREQLGKAPTLDVYRNATDRATQFLEILKDSPDTQDGSYPEIKDLRPRGPEIEAFLYATKVQAWIAGAETDDEFNQPDTEAKMRALMAQNPANADLPFYLALMDLHQGQRAAQQALGTGDASVATNLYKKAESEMSAALQGQDANPSMHYSMAQVENGLADVDRYTPDSRAKHQALADSEMDKALSLMKGTEPLYPQISLQAANVAITNGNAAKAQTILSSLLKLQGSNPMVVVQMSPLLTGIPDLRPQAIEALDSDINASGSGTAVGARRFLELAALTDLQTGELNDTTNDAVRARIRADIKTHLQQMSDANLDPLKLAQVKARFMMTDGDSIGAIESLTTAMAGNTRLAGDPQLIWMLANAYRSAGERTQAETYIKKIIDGKPNFLPARKMLVEELLADGTEQARLDISDQMGYLRRVAPDDPDVIRLEMLTLDPVADADQIKSLYPQLPEKTVQDLRTKAYVAAKQLQNLDEAARLLELAMAKAPDASDVRTVVLLAQGFDGTKHRAKAIDIVQKALAAHPGDTSLQYTMKALEGTSGAALNAYRDQLIAKDPDVVARNRTLAAESEGAQNWSGAEVHLKAAEAADPNDQQVWNDLFKLYLQTKKYDKMAPYLKKLSDANVDQAHGLLYQFEVAKGQNEVQRQLDIGSQMISTLPEFAMSYFCMGQAYQASGQLQQAIENYDTAIQKKGVGADAAMMLKDEITCYYALNQPEKAMVAIEEGQRRFPADPEFLLLRINYEMEHGEAEAAAQELMDLQKNNPTNPAIYLKLAAADMQIADDKIRVSDRAAANASATAARDVMIDAIKRFPEVPQMYGSLADIYRYAGDLPDAEKTIQSLDARPGWSAKPDAPLMLGELYNKANQPEKAETAYASALDRDKGDPNLILAYSRLLVDHKKYDQALAILTPYAPVNMKIRLERMNVLIAAGKDADAEAEIKLVLDQTSAAAGSSGANPQAANLEAVWAKLELDSGRWSTAADHVAKALAADPKSVTALAVSARLHMAKMPPEVDGALSDLNTARQLRPDDVEVLDALADIYLSRFDTDNAARILQAAVRTQPENVDLRLRLAYVYSDLSPVRLDQAMQVLQDGLILPGGTSNADLAIAIVSIYQKMGKTDQALQNCIVSLNAIPGNLKLIQTYFQLLVDVDRYNDALQSANQILQQNNNLWWAWSIRGQAESGTGDKSSAITDLNKALTIADSQKDSNAAHVIVDTIARTVSADAAISIVRQRQRSEASWDVNLIMLYHQNGQDDLAMAALEPFLAATAQLPPRQRLPRLELAGMIYGTAQPAPVADKAYAIYKQMLAINPDDVEALNNVASLCADDFTPPRVEEGLGYVRHAMDLVTARGTSDPLLEDTYGWLMILGGQTEQGMSILQKAVERASFPEGYYHLGEGDLRLNRPQDALQQVNLALKAISDAQAAKKPLDPMVRVRVQDLSNRVLTALGQR